MERLFDDLVEEISSSVRETDPQGFDDLLSAICESGTIALYGVGREGLQMRGLAMRLYHLGLAAHVVGDMTTPPLGEGDLLIVSAGPGSFSTVIALIDTAAEAGAKVATVTAVANGKAAHAADMTLLIPAQTMANDRSEGASILPMGSLFEVSQFIVFELLINAIRNRLGVSSEAMRARHTNLE